MKKTFAAACFAWLLLAGPLGAIELSQDFDSGSLNVAGSSIVGETIYLAGRKTWTKSTYANYYRWVYFKASGVAGHQPEFRLPSSTFLGDLSDHRFLYSYDQTNWDYFDNGYIASGTYYFGNDAPFLGGDVYVAYSLPYPFSRTQQHMAAVAQSPFVQPTASGGGDFVVGQTAGGVDDLGRTIAPNDLYGFKISDPGGRADKVKVLLASGNHSCETPGNHALEGMIDFLLGDSREAAGLRRVADFYVYPQVNPDGRIAGYYRSSVENPDKDNNRYWNNPDGMTDMTAVRDAMILDTDGDVDYLFDFHSMFGPWSRSPYYETRSTSATSDFALALAELEPGIKQSVTAGLLGMLRIWGIYGLNAEHSFTPEFGCQPGVLEARLDEMGANYARALYRALVPTWNLVPGDANGDGLVDEADAAVLAGHWGSPGADWSMGDFDGDGLVGPSDASVLAANWGYGSIPAVPEPAAMLHLFLAGVLCLRLVGRRRRR